MLKEFAFPLIYCALFLRVWIPLACSIYLHGWVQRHTERLFAGDPIQKPPILNPFGSLVFPFIAFTVRLTTNSPMVFGWGKLVYSRKLSWLQNLAVVLSGSLVNITLALLILGLDTYVFHTASLMERFPFFWFINPWITDVVRMNFMIALVGLLPFYPFDASRLIAPFISEEQDRGLTRFKIIGLMLTVLVFALPMTWEWMDTVVESVINLVAH